MSKITQPKWPRPILVSQRLPEFEVRIRVIMFNSEKSQWSAGYLTRKNQNGWLDADGDIILWRSDLMRKELPLDTNITHWLPLPPAPDDAKR